MTMKIAVRLVLGLAMLMGVGQVWAQSATGTIAGTVTDPDCGVEW
jgi:hypothetical protein